MSGKLNQTSGTNYTEDFEGDEEESENSPTTPGATLKATLPSLAGTSTIKDASKHPELTPPVASDIKTPGNETNKNTAASSTSAAATGSVSPSAQQAAANSKPALESTGPLSGAVEHSLATNSSNDVTSEMASRNPVSREDAAATESGGVASPTSKNEADASHHSDIKPPSQAVPATASGGVVSPTGKNEVVAAQGSSTTPSSQAVPATTSGGVASPTSKNEAAAAQHSSTTPLSQAVPATTSGGVASPTSKNEVAAQHSNTKPSSQAVPATTSGGVTSPTGKNEGVAQNSSAPGASEPQAGSSTLGAAVAGGHAGTKTNEPGGSTSPTPSSSKHNTFYTKKEDVSGKDARQEAPSAEFATTPKSKSLSALGSFNDLRSKTEFSLPGYKIGDVVTFSSFGKHLQGKIAQRAHESNDGDWVVHVKQAGGKSRGGGSNSSYTEHLVHSRDICGVEKDPTYMRSLSNFRTGPKFSLGEKLPSSFIRSSSTPAPGAYSLPGDDNSAKYKAQPRFSFGGCARFGLGQSPAKQMPGPGAYNPKDPTLHMIPKVGFGSGARAKAALVSQHNPGPGAYEARSSLGEGRMFTAGGRHPVNHTRSRSQPGPGAYSPSLRSVKEASPMCGFGTAVRGDVPGARSGQAPGPGSYEMQSFRGTGSGAPKYSTSSRHRLVDLNSYVTPGPGSYNSHITSFECPSRHYIAG